MELKYNKYVRYYQKQGNFKYDKNLEIIKGGFFLLLHTHIYVYIFLKGIAK